MDPARIAVRALAAFVYLLFVTRSTGKRVVAQATPFDFVLALILGDLIDDALWAEVAFTRFAAAVAAIVSLDIVVKLLASHSDGFFRIVAGHPRRVMEHGARVRGGMRRLQVNDADLDSLLRQQEIADGREVRSGFIEIDGQLSVLKEPSAEPAQRRDRDKVRESMP